MKASRRKFLCAVSATALTAALPKSVLAWRSGIAAAVVPATFQGNPNTTISSITGSIAISRTTVATPGFVQVSAAAFTSATGAGISCSGTRTLGAGTSAAVPYEDLEFNWNFGDASGVEIFTRPTDGATVNANLQTGPEAVYCYRNAGSYTIILTVRGKNGSGYVTATFAQAVTVNAFSASNGTRYVDSVNGSLSYDGTAPAFTGGTTGPWLDLSASNLNGGWPTFQLSTGNKRVRIAQGSNVTDGYGLRFTQNGTSNFRFDSYVGASGAGPNPIITMNTGSNYAIGPGTPASGTRDDIVYSNIHCVGATGWAANTAQALVEFVPGTTAGTMSNIYFDNCTFDVSGLASSNQCPILVSFNGGTGGYSQTQQYWGIWGGQMIAPVYTTGSGQKHNFFGGPVTQGLCLYGVSFSGSGTNNTLDHHIYPETQNHTIYKWLTFGVTGTGSYQRNYCINTNYDNFISSSLPNVAQYHCFSECAFANTVYMHDLDNSDNNPNQTQFTNFVVEKNAVSGMTGAYITLFDGGASYTFRDNRVWSNAAGGVINQPGVADAIFVPSIYRNRIYLPSSAVTGQAFGNLGALNAITFNTTDTNIYFANPSYIPSGTAVKLVGANLPSGFNNSTIYYVVNSYMVRSEEGAAIFNTSNKNIVAPCVATFPLETQVQFGSGTLPAEFSLSTNYFIVSNTGGNIQLSATRAGGAIQASSAGGGSVTIFCYAFTLGTSPAGPAIQATSTGSGSITMQPQWIVQPKTLTDNVIWDARATANIVGEVFADQATALSLYDRNQYWAGAGTTNSTNIFTNNGTGQDFTQWNGFSPPYFDADKPTGISANVFAPTWTVPPAQWSDFGP